MNNIQKSLVFLACLTTGLASAQVRGEFYSIDTQHSVLDFRAKHIGFGSVRGRFTDYEGTIYFDSTNLLNTSASVVLKVESIETGTSGRDGVLKEEFFQVKDNPFVVFTSSNVVKRGQQLYLVGNLTMGAVTNRVEIPFIHTVGPVKDQWEHKRIVFEGGITIHRMDYKLFYRSSKFWDSIVEDSIKIEMDVGARVYNSLKTVFPFRENSVGRIAFEALQKGGAKEARKRIGEVFANPKDYNTSVSQMLRGATHAEQSGNIRGAIDLIDLFLELSTEEMSDEVTAEFHARKAKCYLLLNDIPKTKEACTKALSLYKNTLAMEVQKAAGRR